MSGPDSEDEMKQTTASEQDLPSHLILDTEQLPTAAFNIAGSAVHVMQQSKNHCLCLYCSPCVLLHMDWCDGNASAVWRRMENRVVCSSCAKHFPQKTRRTRTENRTQIIVI